MLNMLKALTSNTWFMPMEKFNEYFYNGKEISETVDLTGCVEFGTNNGREILIYDIEEGQKHIRYSCSYAEIYKQPVITHVFNKAENVYEYDYDRFLFDITNTPELMQKYRVDTLIKNIDKAIEKAEESLDDPNEYGMLLAYTNYMYSMGNYHAYMDSLDILDADQWLEIAQKYQNKINELEKRADVLYRNLKSMTTKN